MRTPSEDQIRLWVMECGFGETAMWLDGPRFEKFAFLVQSWSRDQMAAEFAVELDKQIAQFEAKYSTNH